MKSRILARWRPLELLGLASLFFVCSFCIGTLLAQIGPNMDAMGFIAAATISILVVLEILITAWIFRELRMNRLTDGRFLQAALLVLLTAGLIPFAGCATSTIAMRSTNGAKGDPSRNVRPGDAWYIESKSSDGTQPYSCSFVEFDERGDYLDFRQQPRSWEKIAELAKTDELLVVIYCHGWKNNSQSGNVVEFNRFLGRLASSPEIQQHRLRVHGLYLAWRGNLFYPAIDKNSEAFQQTTADFGSPIINENYSRKIPFVLWIPEQLSYWSRKGAAENKVSGIPIARTIFTAANAAKHFSQPGKTNRVVVIGHSFGALMLEKSLGQACVGALTDQWKWRTSGTTNVLPTTIESLPFDCILFVNSAAPSLYAKELSDLLWAHKNALRRSGTPGAEAPVIISVTSSADPATRYAHRIANVLAPFDPSLQRTYTEGVLDPQSSLPPVPVRQSYFYEHTPGHNPLLVDHWITRKTSGGPGEHLPENDPRYVFAANLNLATSDPTVFFTTDDSKTATGPKIWKIGTESDPSGWAQYRERRPVARGDYWIVRCNKELIANHSAIWTTTTMELYAALYRLAEVKRREAITRRANF